MVDGNADVFVADDDAAFDCKAKGPPLLIAARAFKLSKFRGLNMLLVLPTPALAEFTAEVICLLGLAADTTCSGLASPFVLEAVAVGSLRYWTASRIL